MTGMRPMAPREPKYGDTRVNAHHSSAVAARVAQVTWCCHVKNTRAPESNTGTRATEGLYATTMAMKEMPSITTPTGTPTPIHSAKPSSHEVGEAALLLHVASSETIAAAF